MAQGARGIAQPPAWSVRRLQWQDEEIGAIPLPARPLRMVMGLGSGLARRPNDEPGLVWAVGDRGPNLKPRTLIERYGLEAMRDVARHSGAKVMPRLDVGPTIARLRVAGDRVELAGTLRITAADGTPVSGLPNPASLHAQSEPAFDLAGTPLAADPRGLDSEGLIALADGGFWVGDEFGPSLVRLDAQARITARYVPEGCGDSGAADRLEERLPAIAARRQLNRGFEAIAISPDERWLYLAFQSPLAHPDEAAHKHGRHTRLWRLDAVTLSVTGQFLYPFDEPASFLRDNKDGRVEWSDIKVSELVSLGEDRLIVLERCSATTKLYLVNLDPAAMLGPEHLDVATRPTAEQSTGLPVLAKQLLFNTDDAREVARDLEGMAVLSPTELLLVNDNDFGVEGAETEFWLVEFAQPLLA